MTVQIRLIPDGSARIPAEAKDHKILKTHLESAGDIPAVEGDPIEGWEDIERVVPGSGESVKLRGPNAVSDYDQATLNAIRDAVITNIDGLKAHPGGWQDIPEYE